MTRVILGLAPCPLCAGSLYSPYKFGLVQCKSCELVLSHKIWEPHANEQMESEWFGENYLTRPSVWVNAFEKWNNRKTLARVREAKPPGNRLLEIGVGSGSFLASARNEGYLVEGCDLSEPICRMVTQHYGVSMHNEAVASLAGESLFDIIVMNHVLEHVDKPAEFVGDVRRLLKPAGVVYVAVPNIACWEALLSGWNSYEPYHLAYFSPRTLRQVVNSGGLAVEDVTTHDSFSGWFLAVLRTALRVSRTKGEPQSPSGALDPKVRHRALLTEQLYRIAMVSAGGVSWPLRGVQGLLGYGDEVVCLARRVDGTASA